MLVIRCLFFCFFFFFFSSRRRHTRLQGDWSSDVCSSDLCGHPGRLLRASSAAGCRPAYPQPPPPADRRATGRLGHRPALRSAWLPHADAGGPLVGRRPQPRRTSLRGECPRLHRRSAPLRVSPPADRGRAVDPDPAVRPILHPGHWWHDPFVLDRKSTRLNSSHLVISYAVFCLKKKNKTQPYHHPYDVPASRHPRP